LNINGFSSITIPRKGLPDVPVAAFREGGQASFYPFNFFLKKAIPDGCVQIEAQKTFPRLP
jgi:hypothetical protein